MYSVYDYEFYDEKDIQYCASVEYAIRPAEKDVGIMSAYVDFEVIKIVEVETDKEVNDEVFTSNNIEDWLVENTDIDSEIMEHERSEWEYAQECRSERAAENRRLREGENV